MNKKIIITICCIVGLVLAVSSASAFKFPFLSGSKDKGLTPKNGEVQIPLKDISDGKAHFYTVKSKDGVNVKFFTLKSRDGVIRAAIDACDVCYKAGKGYVQSGEFMVCENCGQRFASNKINVLKGGCNPAPLRRVIKGDKLIISMNDLNANSWYCRYK